jgi:hypothetical protein
MRKLTKRSTAIIAASVVAVGAAGAAYAWSLTATGTTTASAAEKGSIAVNNVTTIGKLYPTGKSGISFTVTNNADYPIVPKTVTITGVTTESTTCAATNVSAVNTGAFTLVLPPTIASKTTSTPITVANAVEMKADAPEGCIGQAFDVEVTVSADTPSA